jgi:hypothetical protein
VQTKEGYAVVKLLRVEQKQKVPKNAIPVADVPGYVSERISQLVPFNFTNLPVEPDPSNHCFRLKSVALTLILEYDFIRGNIE